MLLTCDELRARQAGCQPTFQKALYAGLIQFNED